MRLLQWLGIMALLSSCTAYKFLVVFPMPSKSHSILGKGIVNSLLTAGHEVTFISTYPDKNPQKNLKLVNASVLQNIVRENKHNMFTRNDKNSIRMVKELAYNVSTAMLALPSVQSILMDPKQRFDAVVTEWFFSDIFSGLSQIFECPWILFSPMGMSAGVEYLVDEIQSPAVQPFLILGYTVPMTLKERIINTAFVAGSMAMTLYEDHPRDEAAYNTLYSAAAKARGVKMAEFSQAIHNISILLINSHPSLGQATRLPPNAVEISGYHINPNTPALPKDLQELLDNSPDGVIYFSLGSVISSADLPQEKRKYILDTFRKLKQTILWKFETDLPDAPKNVHISSWLPQQSILAHKNVKLFISHGGLLSTTEAIHYGVPIIGIPVFGDQPMNMDRAVKKGYALKVDVYSSSLPHDLEEAIQEMLNNPKYGNTAKHLSALFHDRPAHPAALIAYWTEHAVRTRGAAHLRTAASSVPAYQRYLLDIFGILFAVLALIYYLLRAAVRYIFCKSQSFDTQSRSKKKKN